MVEPYPHSVLQSMPEVCTFFLQGKCLHADTCKYSHLRPPCKFGRNCARRNSCLYAHGIAPLTTTQHTLVRPVARKTTIECRFWAAGTCKRADCDFVHSSASRPGALLTTQATPLSPIRPVSFAPIQRCRYFDRGRCTSENCTFLHVAPEISKASSNPQEATPVSPKSLNFSAHPSPRRHLPRKTIPTNDDILPETWDERFIGGHSKVKFLAGLSIEQVLAANESVRLVIFNLPGQITREQLTGICEPFGAVESAQVFFSTLETSSGTIFYKEAASAKQAAASLNNSLHDTRVLSARVVEMITNSEVRAAAGHRVEVSWYLPSYSAYAHYQLVRFAQEHARRLNGTEFSSRTIQATFQKPSMRQSESFTVILHGLPPPETYNEDQLRRFCRAQSITRGKISYDLEGVKRALQRHLEAYGDIESFEVLDHIPGSQQAKAIAHFTSKERALVAVARLTENSTLTLERNKIRVWAAIVYSVKLKVLRDAYNAVSDLIAASLPPTLKMRVHDQKEMGTRVTIVIYGQDAKLIDREREQIRSLVQGDLLENDDGTAIWNDFFETEGGEDFLAECKLRTLAFINLKHQQRTVWIVGTREAKSMCKQLIIEKLTAIKDGQSMLQVDRGVLHFLLADGLADLCKEFEITEPKLRLVEGIYTVVIQDADEEKKLLLEVALADVARKLAKGKGVMRGDEEVDCPICFCPASAPIRLNCGHAYCLPCMKLHLTSLLDVVSIRTPLRCAGDEDKCMTPIPLGIIRKLLDRGAEERLYERTFNTYVSQHQNEFAFCPSVDCGVVYRIGNDNLTFQCPGCNSDICTACQTEGHDGITCAEQRDIRSGNLAALERWKREHNVKSCPQCHVDIEKAEGCNHMTCKMCNTHICWVCMKTFRDGGLVYSHLQQEHGGIHDRGGIYDPVF